MFRSGFGSLKILISSCVLHCFFCGFCSKLVSDLVFFSVDNFDMFAYTLLPFLRFVLVIYHIDSLVSAKCCWIFFVCNFQEELQLRVSEIFAQDSKYVISFVCCCFLLFYQI